jgi:hypothetical protein
MEDRREQILSRLVEIAKGIDGGELGAISVFRNRSEVSGPQRPAIVILDADEKADDRDRSSRRPANAPRIIIMMPEVSILVAAASANVGSSLNALRFKLILAVMNDADLISLSCGSAGDIAYEGAATDFARERTMSGEMVVSFTINYLQQFLL